MHCDVEFQVYAMDSASRRSNSGLTPIWSWAPDGVGDAVGPTRACCSCCLESGPRQSWRLCGPESNAARQAHVAVYVLYYVEQGCRTLSRNACTLEARVVYNKLNSCLSS